jgi:hypothetical protein
MHITTLIAALIALAGGFVVLRWMPGRPRQAAEATQAAQAIETAQAGDRAYEAELAILEEAMADAADREG